MIKIAFIIDFIWTPAAGSESQLLLLLKNLDRSKFDPTLCVLRSTEWIENEFDLCPTYLVGIDSFKKPGALLKFWKFSRFLAREGFDIAQTHFADSNRFGVAAAKLAGVKKIISTRRNQGFLCRQEILTLKLVNLSVDCFITNSLSTSEWLPTVEGIPKGKITVIYNALDLDAVKKVSENSRYALRNSLGIPQHAFVAGIVANPRPVKRIDLFVRAARLVKNQRPDAYFVVVGSLVSDAMEVHKLRCLIEELGLGDSLYFLGERRNAYELLSAFDVGVLTSLSEGFSNSLIEYVASGLPAVTTDVGGAREVVTSGVNGYVVPVNDYEALAESILNVAKGSLKEQDLFLKQQEALEMFSLNKSIQSYEKLYTDLVTNDFPVFNQLKDHD